MNFQSMDYFTMVAQKRSFTKAAQALHITQQTLSVHIASIERELGCQLFLRRIPLELTYAGEVFLEYALDFQKKYRTMLREFGDISHDQKGRLRIGIAHTRGRTILPAMFQDFQNLHPQIEIQLAEDLNDVLPQKLLNGEIDLAIAHFPEQLPGVTLRDFYEEEVVLLISRELLQETYGSSAGEITGRITEKKEFHLLEKCPFLMNNQQDIAGKIARTFIAKTNIHPKIKAESENIETLLDLCERGFGACFCPDNLTATALSERQLSHMCIFHLDQSARYMIRFGWPEHSYQWNVLTDFMDISLACHKKEHLSS